MRSAAVRIPLRILVLAVWWLRPIGAQAAPITVNLGESAEDFVEYGLGANADNLGTYAFDQGACAFDGSNTSCTLSGAFTGSSAPFGSGTYTLVTRYVGNDRTQALGGTSLASEPDFFTYTSGSLSTSITLNLVTASRTVVLPLFADGIFAPAVTSFAFSLVPPYTCSGVPVDPCTPELVGLTNGAIGQSRVTTVVSFDDSCVGDCDGNRKVTVANLIELVNIALGNAPPSTCRDGIPSGTKVDVALIVQAVNDALNGCAIP